MRATPFAKCGSGHGRIWRCGAAMLVVAAMVGGMSLTLAGCEKTQAQEAAAPPPPTVVVAKVEQRDVVPYEIRTGSLRAKQYVKILPRVTGFIESIDFIPGRFVQPGTVLFKLDARPFIAKLDEAKADLGVREANQQYASDELTRQEGLIKQQATSPKELSDARNKKRQADASVEAGKAAVRTAELNLGYCTIASPIAGKVDTNAVDLGELVGATGQRQALTTVAELDPIIVDFTFPEDFIVAYMKTHTFGRDHAPAIPVKLSLGTENDFRYDATLDFISNTVDESTGTVAAQATAPNPDLKLYPGLFVRVKVDLTPMKNALLIREDAIGRDIGGDFIWIIKPDNTAEKRYVKLGTLVDDKRVVQTGLAANETYVMQGMQRVRERGKVTPQPAPAPSSQPAEAAASANTENNHR